LQSYTDLFTKIVSCPFDDYESASKTLKRHKATDDTKNQANDFDNIMGQVMEEEQQLQI